MKKLIYRGSVKDIYQVDNDLLSFRFSNRYSLFDWGTMPDEIPEKGKALVSFCRKLYQKLENPVFWQEYLPEDHDIALRLKQEGLRTHLKNIDCEHDEIIVEKVPDFGRNLDEYQKKPAPAFIPLEVIFRLGVPKGSSLLSRRPNEFTEGQLFSIPLIECSTKWERLDRMLSWSEAAKIAAMSLNEEEAFFTINQCLAMALNNFFKSVGLSLWDGKSEWAYIPNQLNPKQRDFMLVDSIGPDELRLSAFELPLSKEFLRSWYRKTKWYSEMTQAKATFGNDFKNHCSSPPSLPKDLVIAVSEMYQQLTNLLYGKADLKSLSRDLRKFI